MIINLFKETWNECSMPFLATYSLVSEPLKSWASIFISYTLFLNLFPSFSTDNQYCFLDLSVLDFHTDLPKSLFSDPIPFPDLKCHKRKGLPKSLSLERAHFYRESTDSQISFHEWCLCLHPSFQFYSPWAIFNREICQNPKWLCSSLNSSSF